MFEILETIRSELQIAEQEKRKVTTFHFLVLKHASVLNKVDKYEFCDAVGMKESFVAEFDKMIRLAKHLETEGVILAKPI